MVGSFLLRRARFSRSRRRQSIGFFGKATGTTDCTDRTDNPSSVSIYPCYSCDPWFMMLWLRLRPAWTHPRSGSHRFLTSHTFLTTSSASPPPPRGVCPCILPSVLTPSGGPPMFSCLVAAVVALTFAQQEPPASANRTIDPAALFERLADGNDV